MHLAYTNRFRNAYAALDDRGADRVRKALEHLAANLRHPGLRVRKMQGTERIWEARASDSIRITFETDEGRILLRNVGAHDATLKKP